MSVQNDPYKRLRVWENCYIFQLEPSQYQSPKIVQLMLVLGPLHTQVGEPMTITLQALSLVGKVEPVQVRFTLRLRDQRSMWMQDDGCIVFMDSYMASNGSCFLVTWIVLQKTPLGSRPNTKPLGDHGTSNARNRWLILFHHVWRPTWIKNSSLK